MKSATLGNDISKAEVLNVSPPAQSPKQTDKTEQEEPCRFEFFALGRCFASGTPNNYWQVNAPEKGYAAAALFSDNGQMGGRSILGLPLMNNYFTIFDRSVDSGLGAVKFAPVK